LAGTAPLQILVFARICTCYKSFHFVPFRSASLHFTHLNVAKNIACRDSCRCHVVTSAKREGSTYALILVAATRPGRNTETVHGLENAWQAAKPEPTTDWLVSPSEDADAKPATKAEATAAAVANRKDREETSAVQGFSEVTAFVGCSSATRILSCDCCSHLAARTSVARFACAVFRGSKDIKPFEFWEAACLL